MAHIDTFKLNGNTIPLTDGSYVEHRQAIDDVATTEGGTFRRDVLRASFLNSMELTFTTIGSVKRAFDATYAPAASLTATIWADTTGTGTTSWTCFISKYTATLVRDTKNGETYWSISITLNDLTA